MKMTWLLRIFASFRPIFSDGGVFAFLHPLFDAVGALIRTGPTGTNVADLRVLVVGAAGSSGDPGHSAG